ncbi:hypothetical protein [Cronobacter malonaticus]|uniref:hypothetical protein n=1 Tax=Cronobacter malonaticus TaxID=413503 RepID=UPI000CFD08A2|nr:hypothetical protein [Cronobacter malonaticus]NCH53392.1 hypothetical protein [Cronobacter malonaticus]
MSTISNERLEEMRDYDTCVRLDESAAMATELLALRKERARAEPVSPVVKHINDPYADPDFDEQAKAAPPAPTDKPKSEMSQQAEQLLRDTTELAARLSAETDTTAQQFESLAGKAVVPDGWKLVPVELTKEMRGKIHPFAEATCLDCGRQVVADCEDNVTASWNDMLAAAPAPVGKQSSTAEGNDDGFECTPVSPFAKLITSRIGA